MLITTKLAAFGSIDFPDYHDLLAKIVGMSMEPNAASFVVISIGL